MRFRLRSSHGLVLVLTMAGLIASSTWSEAGGRGGGGGRGGAGGGGGRGGAGYRGGYGDRGRYYGGGGGFGIGIYLGGYPYDYGYGYGGLDYAVGPALNLSYYYPPPPAAAAPVSPTPPPIPAEENPPETPPASGTAPARLNISLPTAGSLNIGGYQTQQTAGARLFETPALVPGKTYAYEIQARWTENGQLKKATKNITLHAGDVIQVDFRPPAGG